MAEASAADGKLKDLKISETKKSKKDGNPKKAAKPQQQQKKKVSYATEKSAGSWTGY
jgi:prolyl-tRNA synthetase